MKIALPENEAERVEALRQYSILDTPPEEAFDALALLAAQILGTPVALINLIDANRQWFKSKVGWEITEAGRYEGFCALCIQQGNVFIISDTWADELSKANPVVTAHPYVRFYAGAPLIVSGGYAIGTLCVVDFAPREIQPQQVEALQLLGRQVVRQLELRRNLAAREDFSAKRDRTSSSLQKFAPQKLQLASAIATRTQEREISSMQTTEQIKADIEDKFGFFPPFFSPAQENPQVLENLWQQTLTAYVNNPLSDLFKEKLSAYLSRYCAVPYCMICHSCSLLGMGVNPGEVLQLLQSPPPASNEIDKYLNVLAGQPDLEALLLESNPAVEESLLYCAIVISIEGEQAENCRAELRRLLGAVNYQHLITFVAYVKTCHAWMEAHPEVAYEADKRAIDYLEQLLKGAPGLAEFFRNYVDKVRRERQSWAEQVAELTERQRNHEAIRRSEERYRTLIEQASDGIFIADIQGNYVDVNTSGCTMLGYSRTEILQMSISDIVPNEDIPLVAKAIEELQDGQAQVKEWQLKHKDGKLIPVEISTKILPDGRLQAIARDITERKRADSLLKGQKRVLEMIATGASLADVLHTLVQTIEKQSSGMLCSILLVDKNGRHLRHGAAPSLPENYNREIDGIAIDTNAGCCGTAAYLGQPVLISDIANEALWTDFKDLALSHELRSCWSTPILSTQGKVLGTFAMYYRQPRHPDTQDLQLIEIAVHLAGIAIERQRKEEALRASENHLRAIIDAEPECVKLVAADGTLLDMNTAGLGMIEVDRADAAIGKSIYPLVVPEYREAFQQLNESVCQGNKGSLEFEIVGRKGTRRWMETHAVPLLNESDETIVQLAIARDITERKQAEEAIRASEEKFRNLVEQTSDWIWEIDNQGVFTYVSPQARDILGYELEEIIGKTTFDFMVLEEIEQFSQLLGEYIFKQEPFIRLEKTLLHKNGNRVVLETCGSPVFDRQGVLQGYRGIARDITERKRVEEALRQSEQRFRTLTEAIPQQVWTAQPDGALDYFNGRVLDYFDRSLEEMLGWGWQQVLHPDDVQQCIERWSNSLKMGDAYEIEFRLLCAESGSYRWHLGRALPIHDDNGQIVSWFGTNTDIDDRKRAEEERDRFFTLSLDMLCISNFDGYFTRLNPAWEKTIGYTNSELTCRPFIDFVHPEDQAKTIAETERLALGSASIYFENRYRCQDGSYKWLAWKAAPVVEAGLVYAIARDITPNKLAEQERLRLLEREQAARHRIGNILESITDAFYALDHEWRFTYLNQQAEALLCRTREELIGKNIWDEFSEALNVSFYEQYHQAVSEQISVEFEEFYPPLNKWFELHAYPSKDGLSVYFKDITERKQAQAELQRQNLRSQLFAELSLKIRQSLQLEEILQTTVSEVQSILESDRLLVYRIWPDGAGSAVAEAVVPGWQPILGQTFPAEVIPEEYRQMYSQGRVRAIEDTQNSELTPCMVEFSQQFNIKAKLIVPILLNKELWGLLIAHQCSTPRQWSSFEIELLQPLANQIGIALAQAQLLEQETRQRQELMRSNEELQQFAYIASHDLQEPLRKIQAFGDRLKNKYHDQLAEQGSDYIERMQNAAQRMQVLINDLLALSRVKTKVQSFVPMNLAQAAQEVLSDLEVRIQKTGGRVEVGDLPTINADPLQMRQLLQNLIGNALKFHRDEEPPVVKIYGRKLFGEEQQSAGISPAGDIYQIFVEDNGIGFDEKYLDRIFNVFQRLHSRSEYEGTGMGLAICRKIVEHHGGSITAKSTLGQGTTFIVTLPIKQHTGENNSEGTQTTSDNIDG
jgi:PAS domain S-box-containing protein